MELESCERQLGETAENSIRNDARESRSRRASGSEQGDRRAFKDLPHRILLEIKGVEWFIHNRTPSYDAILGAMSRSTNAHHDTPLATTELDGVSGAAPLSAGEPDGEDHSTALTASPSPPVARSIVEKVDSDFGLANSHLNSSNTGQEEDVGQSKNNDSLPAYLKVLPIGVICGRGAIVMGNEYTKCVLVAQFDGAEGQVHAHGAGPYDQYRQSFDLDFVHPVIHMKPNKEYRGDRMETTDQFQQMPKSSKFGYPSCLKFGKAIQTATHLLTGLFAPFSNSAESVTQKTVEVPGNLTGPSEKIGTDSGARWLGLSRYLEEDDDGLIEQERWKAVEYGCFQVVLDCPKMALSYYWDIAGQVFNAPAELNQHIGFETDINGCRPPAWGVHMKIGGGTIHYGPWADRQRLSLQNVFFPSSYADATVPESLKPGQSRVSTVFTIVIEIESEVTLVIPTREESKDWKWKDRVTHGKDPSAARHDRRKNSKAQKGESFTLQPEIRPAGWLDIAISQDSSITYIMDMVASKTGFRNKLDLDLKSPSMSTSINHGILLRSKAQTISCDLSNPLSWNSPRYWTFDISGDQLELFILRDHVYLLSDLINDWTTGSSEAFHTFTPFHYAFNLQFPNFKIYLNANDSNIINNPSDINDNTFIVIWGEQLNAHINLPQEDFSPVTNKVTFDVDAHKGGLQLRTPMWNTQHTLLNSAEVATLKALRLNGSYNYCTSTSQSLTDTVLLHLHGIAPTIHLYGYLIRYFINFKDNYFGDDIHFLTLEEYQLRINKILIGDTIGHDEVPHGRLSNDLDVILSIAAEDACLMIPANLYSAKKYIKINISSISLDLRFTNYYMDLEAIFSPLAVAQATADESQTITDVADTATQIFIDGITLDGHRLFGLPPVEPTYMCNWDFSVGRVTGECSIDFLSVLTLTARCFAFAFSDAENAMPPHNPIILHDVTFLRARVEPIRIWLHVKQSAFLLSTDIIKIHFNDWIGKCFAERLHLICPQLAFACVDSRTASRHHTKQQPDVITYACVKTSLDIRMVEAMSSSSENRRLQQEHIFLQDVRTSRTPWLVHTEGRNYSLGQLEQRANIRPAAMPFPRIPMPVKLASNEDNSNIPPKPSCDKFNRTKGIGSRQSSFFTQSSISQPIQSSELASSHRDNSQQGSLISSSSTSALEGSSPIGSFLPISFSLSSRKSSVTIPRATIDRSPNGPSPSRITFSTTFGVPYFPLQAIEPDIRDLPQPLDADLGAADPLRQPVSDQESLLIENNDTTHTTIIIRFDAGISALCTPEALQQTNEILDNLQPKDPESILDTIQITSINDVLSLKKSQKLKSNFQLSLYVPFIALRFRSEARFQDNPDSEGQRYDLKIAGLNFYGRFGPQEREQGSDARNQILSLYLSSKQMSLTAETSPCQHTGHQARISLSLSNVIGRLVNSHGLVGSLHYQSMNLISLDPRVKYLVSFIYKTAKIIEGCQQKFQESLTKQTNRLRYLLHHLATSGAAVADPAFLTNASYVLRTADDHIRSCDTWKMTLRLRFIHANMTFRLQQELCNKCLQPAILYPTDAREQIITSFNEWRSWDLEQAANSALLESVFGTTPVDIGEPNISTSIRVALEASSTCILIGSGPQPNRLAIGSLTVAAASIPPSNRPLSSHQNHITNDSSLTARIVCYKVTVHLNWEICELVEDILRQSRETQSVISEVAVAEPLTEQIERESSLQVVFVIENSDISFTSINLRGVSSSRGLQASLAISQLGSRFETVSGLVSAETITSMISDQSRVILASTLYSPCINTSVQCSRHTIPDIKTWLAGALCRELDFEIREDLLGILAICDAVLKDEIAYLHLFAQSLKGLESSSDSVSKTRLRSGANKVYFTFVLETFRAVVTLLPTVQYILHGKIARSSIRPLAGSGQRLKFDFDIKSHTHAFANKVGATNQEIARIQIPPVNGQLLLRNLDLTLSIDVFVAIEQITFDASLVHDLLSISSQAEILSFGKNVSRDAELIKGDYGNLFGFSGARHPPKSKVFYHARVTAAGLAIGTTTEVVNNQCTQLRLQLGRINMYTHNNESGSEEILQFPEISVGFQTIQAFLKRYEGRNGYPCGNFNIAASFRGTSKTTEAGNTIRSYQVISSGFKVTLYTHTASMIVNILGNLKQRFRDIDLSEEVRSLRTKRRLRSRSIMLRDTARSSTETEEPDPPAVLFASMYALEMTNVQVIWQIGDLSPASPGHEMEDLIFSITKIDLATQKQNAARLMIQNLQLQMVPATQLKLARSDNSALMPEVVFNVAYLSTSKDRRLAFQAAGKSLDLRLTSQFILPASGLKSSIGLAIQELRKVTEGWNASLTESDEPTRGIFGRKKLSSLLVDADFAGAVVYIQGRKIGDTPTQAVNVLRNSAKSPQHGRYGQFVQDDASTSTTMRSPGIALKVEYQDFGTDNPSLNAEIKVDASNNVLYPAIVPLILEISSSVKQVVGEPSATQSLHGTQSSSSRSSDEDAIKVVDAAAILGNCRLNLGLRICSQEFSLSCQPIARVAATAQFEDIYITLNTVRSPDGNRFFAISALLKHPKASVQHVYSRESTGSFEVESVNLSLMNSKHVSVAKGITMILKVNPMKVVVNAKQLHDFLLFREIWVPLEMRDSTPPTTATEAPGSQQFVVQRYQQVAAASAFSWDATLSITKLDIQLDLGQSLGKSEFSVSNFWTSSKKSSGWEQNLCLGFDEIEMKSTGRMSGFIELRNLRVRTAIWWPDRQAAKYQTPLIQASVTLDDFHTKAAFDFQAFFVARLSSLKCLMYNTRDARRTSGDRLVGTVDGDKIQAYFTTTSSAQGLALYQTVQRIISERKQAYGNSLKDIEKYLRRNPSLISSVAPPTYTPNEATTRTPGQLQTNVVVSLKAVNLGVFPSSLYDNQVFKLEAQDVSARFAVALANRQICSGLGLTLGGLRIALSGITRATVPKTLGEVSVDEVIGCATGSRGGTILRVPRVIATMHTWQTPEVHQIGYTFRSTFEGKVEVGWNYSRISFIRGMWANHSRALAQRLGKPLPPSALQITGGPRPATGGDADDGFDGVRRDGDAVEQQGKITAVVHVAQSKYTYTALEPPVIDTPQLKDMGEATPPLEWIGLNRERLPNLTHQIVIVPLLGVAKEVEDAYERILGSS